MPNALDNLTLRASVLEVLIQTDFTLRGPSTLGRHEGFCKEFPVFGSHAEADNVNNVGTRSFSLR